MPFAVCVTMHIAEGRMDEFMPLMMENAGASRAEEPGCRQFDVLTDPARPAEVFLYELYDDAAAFDAHRETAHYARFDARASEMIEEKRVTTWAEVGR